MSDGKILKAFIISGCTVFLNLNPFFSLASNLYCYLTHGTVIPKSNLARK